MIADSGAGTFRPSHPVWLLRRAVQLEGVAPDARDESPDPARASRLASLASGIARELDSGEPAPFTKDDLHALRVEEEHLVQRADAMIRTRDRTSEELRRAEDWLLFAATFREIAAVIAGRLAVARGGAERQDEAGA